MADLELTLSWLDMSQYLDRFLQAGFDSWETVLEITEEDLEVLDVDLGHRRKLQREIANTRRLANDPAFVTPLYPSLHGQGGHDMGRSLTFGRDDTHTAGQGKRSYRHHPKPDPNAPQRPYSAYVLFSNNMREEHKSQGLSFTEMSRRVGERWQSLDPEEKESWKQKAALPWENYKTELAEYQQSDDYKKHAQYLADFKRGQWVKKGENAPRKTEVSQPISPVAHVPPVMRAMAPLSSPYVEVKPESSKIAISRIRQDSNVSATTIAGSRGQRIGHACEPCRQRKTRCPGERPTCQNCKNLDVTCVYADGKKVLEKKLLDNLWKKVTAYEILLLRFLAQVDDEDQSAIQKSLLMSPQSEDVKHTSMLSQSLGSDHAGEEHASGVGSMGSTDIANEEDFRQYGAEEQAQTFIGNASEEKWLQRLERELSESDRSESEPKLHPPPNLAGSTGQHRRTSKTEQFPYPEDMDTSIIGNEIDPYGLPVKSAADALVRTYFATVHPSFPIIDRALFSHQFEEYFTMSESQTFRDRTFITALQIVFAIGAVHAHRTGAEWAGDDRDHLLYFARARVLGIEMGILSDMVYLGQVQVFGLSGMYFMVTNQINRAWAMLALAIRYAQALGTHLQNSTPTLSNAAKDLRAHIWYSIVSLERVMTVMTSRPSMIRDRDCSVPLPSLNLQDQALADQKLGSTSKDFARHMPGPSLSQAVFGRVGAGEKPSLLPSRRLNSTGYFRYYVEINALAQQAVSRLYSPEVRHLKWSNIQRRILELDGKLVEWASNLPQTMTFQGSSPADAARRKEPLQQALGMLFYSTRTIINRPCLCRLDRLIARQSDISLETNRDMANTCVRSAQAMLALIPDEPELDTVYASPLWWVMHRYLKRAGTVLLLELAFRARHMPSQSEQLLVDAKKAVRWLRAMSRTSPPAEQSWIALSWLLKRAGRRVGGDTTDVIDPSNTRQQQQHHHHQPPPEVRSTTHAVSLLPAPAEVWQPLDDAYSRDPQMPGRFFGDLETLELDQFGFPQASTGVANLFPTASEIHDLRANDREDEELEEERGERVEFKGGEKEEEEEEEEEDEEGGARVELEGGEEEEEEEEGEKEYEDEDEEMGHMEDVDLRWYDSRADGYR